MVERTCIRCRRRASKAELVRLVWSDGRVVWDREQRLPSRGAYLHPECAGEGVHPRVLSRALRLPGGAAVEMPEVG